MAKNMRKTVVTIIAGTTLLGMTACGSSNNTSNGTNGKPADTGKKYRLRSRTFTRINRRLRTKHSTL